MNIILTGGAGFIGRSLVQAIPEHQFTVVDIRSGFPRGLREGLDVTGEEDIEKIDWDVDCVVHMAGLTDPAGGYRFPEEDVEINIVGGLNVLMASLKVPNFIFASSCAVYGGREQYWFDEEDSCNPVSPYGVSKLAMEKYIQVYRKEATILRLPNIYGPLDYKYLMYHLFHDEPVVLYGEGKMIREFLYISDLVDLIRRVLGCGTDHKVEVFNVGGYTSMVRDILAEVGKYRKAGSIKKLAKRPGEMSCLTMDSMKVQETFGWVGEVGIPEGVKELAEVWLKDEDRRKK